MNSSGRSYQGKFQGGRGHVSGCESVLLNICKDDKDFSEITK